MTWHPDTPMEYRDAIVTGDARELAKRIPDASVDLIFTDPVYDRIEDYAWIAREAARILRPGGNLLMYQAHLYIPRTFEALADTPLKFRWLVSDLKIGTASLVWGGRVRAMTRMALVYYKDPLPTAWLDDVVYSRPSGSAVNHDWSKNPSAVTKWLSMLPSGVMLDPFCGGGTSLACAKNVGRSFIGFEIDPDTAAHARQRLADTQMPLIVVEPEQLELAV